MVLFYSIMQNNTMLIALDTFINDHIKTIHHLRVVTDIDLAELFCIDINVLRKKVNANLNRFPDDFMITISNTEFHILGGVKYAFTEAGLFMLSGLIRTKRAIEINIGMVELLVNRLPGIAFTLLDKTKE